MCGIFCTVSASCIYSCGKCKKLEETIKPFLCRRGPDFLGHKEVNHHFPPARDGEEIENKEAHESLVVCLSASVLHLRGTNIARQPAQDEHGNILAWNGEIFYGLNVGDDESDTTVLLKTLRSPQSELATEQILEVLGSIEGPWSFVYYQAQQSLLWFGRDYFGRRSLLWHLPSSPTDLFSLSSIGRRETDREDFWEELPADGIYCLSLKKLSNYFSGESGSTVSEALSKYPWQDSKDPHAVENGPVRPIKHSFNKELPSHGSLAADAYQVKRVDKKEISRISCNSVSHWSPPKTPHGAPGHEDISVCNAKDTFSRTRHTETLANYTLTQSSPHESCDSASGFNDGPHITNNSDNSCNSSYRTFDVLDQGGEKGAYQIFNNESEDCAGEVLVSNTISQSAKCNAEESSSEDKVRSVIDTETYDKGCFDINTSKNVDGESFCPIERIKLNPGLHSTVHGFKDHQDLIENFVRILTDAVRKRVFNLPRGNETEERCNDVCQTTNDETTSGAKRLSNQRSNVGILFSGGLDSIVLAILADRCIPPEESIDLINVAFEQKTAAKSKVKKRTQKYLHDNNVKDSSETCAENFNVPDRITGRNGLTELKTVNPKRSWNFVEVDVTPQELQEERSRFVSHLVYPQNTVLDDSIGCALWFAARTSGKLLCQQCQDVTVQSPCSHCSSFTSSAKVLVVGMGADEQLGGYSRHRSCFNKDGWIGLMQEMEMEVQRISQRNLGRDDRCISDHGREARYPFLDENVVSFLNSLPVWIKCDPRLPRGVGEKILLRQTAKFIGLRSSSELPKRAIQFGSRIAKLESSTEKGSDKCRRL